MNLNVGRNKTLMMSNTKSTQKQIIQLWEFELSLEKRRFVKKINPLDAWKLQ